MATSRTTQAHQKRVQQIASEAAEKIAADSPLEEEVVVVVEELPPGESARNQAIETFATVFDPRHVTREAFRLAEELLASQKEFALKVAEAMTRTRAA